VLSSDLLPILQERNYADDLKREKLMKLDAKRREYDIVVIGEEAHLAYNRVGLTSFFQHRKVENLYLNPKEWVNALRPSMIPIHANKIISIPPSQKAP
jgi:nitrite reductase (NAD(P)H)